MSRRRLSFISSSVFRQEAYFDS
uniref:Uncharacterized protein n=1 Tax=Anguilla anguilla TaxID=7936 RepID=A0A0E9URL2_ANGAN